MPAVELLARQLQPHYSGELVDLVLLLWLYSNPYETRRRSLVSLRHVLKHMPTFQRPDGQPNVSEKELTQIVLAALQRLKESGFVKVYSRDNMAAQVSLAEKGIDFIRTKLSSTSLQFLEDSGHCT